MGKRITENTISLRLPTELLTLVDDHAHDMRIKSRNKMILDLIRDGLRSRRVIVPDDE